MKKFINTKNIFIASLPLFYLFFCGIQAQAAIGSGPGGIAINFIESNGSTVTQRNTLNLIGSGVNCVDNSGSIRTDCTFTSSGGGGGGSSSVTSAYGSIVTSSANISQFNISTTPVQLKIFASTGQFSNTVPSFTNAQIQVSTAGAYWLGFNLISTGTGNYNFYCGIRVNGNALNPPLSCQDTPSVRCLAFGQVNLSSGDIVTIYANTNSLLNSTITVTDAQLSVFQLGGSSSGGGGGSITSVNAGSGLTGGGSSGAVTLSLSPSSTFYIQNTGTPSTTTQTFSVSSGTVTGTLIDYQGSLQTILMPSATEALRLVNTSSHSVFLVIQTSGTVYWKVGSDITNLRVPTFDIYNATTGVKDISISTNDVASINAIMAFPSLTANYPLQLNSGNQVVSQLIDLTSDVTNILPSANLPSNVDYTNVQQTISASKQFTSSQTFTAGLASSNLASGQCVQTGTNGLLTVTGSACGSGGGGGGGSSSLQISLGNIQVSSPTATVNFSSNSFTAIQSPTGQANIGINFSSVASVSSLPIPGGSDTQIQYNKTGAFAGDSGLVYNYSGSPLNVTLVGSGARWINNGTGAAGFETCGFGVQASGSYLGLVEGNNVTSTIEPAGVQFLYGNSLLYAGGYSKSDGHWTIGDSSGTSKFNISGNLLVGKNIQGTRTAPTNGIMSEGGLTITTGNLAIENLSPNVVHLQSGTSTFYTAQVSTSDLSATGATGTNFLRSDNTWATPAGGVGSISTITAGVNITVANSTGPNVVINVSSSPTFSGPVTFSSTTLGTFFQSLYAAQAKLPGANTPFISNSTGETSAGVYFDDTSTQSVTWTFRAHNYDGRSLYADIIYHSTATSGTIDWGIYTATQTPNSLAVSRDNLTFSVIVTTSVTVGAISLQESIATVALSNTTAHNGDTITVKLEREAGLNDSSVGFGRVTEVDIYE